MDFFNKMADMFIKANRRLKRWQRVVSALSAIVVFITTYSLVLPAITLDKDTASTQSGMEIAASDQESGSDGTVYESEPEEEPVEASAEDSQEESAADDSGSQEAEVSEEQSSDEKAEDYGQDTSSNEEESAAETGKTVELPAADGTSESAKTVEEVQLITEKTQLSYQYIDESFGKDPEDDVDDGYTVYAEFGADAKLPVGVELKVKEITKESDPELYEAYYEKALSEMQDKYDENTELSFARFYDIAFIYNGVEIEPSGDVKVRIEYKQAVEIKQDTTVDAVHFDKNNEEKAEIIDSEIDSEIEKKRENTDETFQTVDFKSDQFSVYGVVASYTVDFEYSVNGKMYQFSLPGGGFVSFTDLVEVLGIIGDTNSEGNGDENESVIVENAEENAANDVVEENSVNFDTNTALTLGDVEVSEATRKFVADVASVEFSTPSLVDVSKVEADTTVGQIKEGRGLECEYSADLTKEQIAEINAQTVEAGDWALISMRPFLSEETLVVTMKTGEVFTVKVTDAQIKTRVMTADGATWDVTVTYDEDAGIPDGSKLNVREIEFNSDEYNKYLDATAQELKLNDTENIGYARYFDIEILHDGEKIEPEKPVRVDISYVSGISVNDGEQVSIVHFGNEETEIITDVSVNEDGTHLSYMQDSFSVTGTVVSVNDASNGGEYVVVLQYNGVYYSVGNEGLLTPIEYNPSTNTVETNTPMLWEYVKDGSNTWLRHRSTAKHIDAGTQVADQWYYKYLNPGTASALSEENSSHQNYYTNDTKVNYTGGKLASAQNGNNYLGVQEIDGKLYVAGQQTANNAAQIYFADVSNYVETNPRPMTNTVNHIDISIKGSAKVDVPLAFGDYYYSNGQKAYSVDREHQKTLELNANNITITSEDMKKAVITAYTIKNGVRKELDNAYYITGYSANSETAYSTDQLRIEGSFKVADIPDYNGTSAQSNNDSNYRNLRLANKVYYNVAATKRMTLTLKDENGNTLYKQTETGLEELTVTMDVTLSASFDYWDKRNECPPLQHYYVWGTDYGYYSRWQSGEIYGEYNSFVSGMDFVLGGDAEASTAGLTAVEITKVLVDTNGHRINPNQTINNTFYIYSNKTGDSTGISNYRLGDEVKGLDIGTYTTPATYNNYNREASRTISVGQDGIGAVYDYDITNGMVYVEEDKDSVPDEIIDTSGNEWKYQYTYIETENVWRNSNVDGGMHVSDDYTKASAHYNSIPEILGDYVDSQGNKTWYNSQTGKTEDVRNGFLEFYVYNVYVNAYGDAEFKKVDDSNPAQPLPGAKFALYEKYENGICSNPVMKDNSAVVVTSLADGAVKFKDIPIGTYYTKEIEAPEGYQINETVYKVVIEDKSKTGAADPKSKVTTLDDQEIQTVVDKKISYGTVTFNKVNVESAAVPDATFTLYTDAECTPGKEVKVNDTVITATSGETDGKVTFTASRTISGNVVEGIETGNYYTKETVIPSGYAKNYQIYFVHIGEGGDDYSFIAPLEDDVVLGGEELVNYYRSKRVDSIINRPVKITVRKVDGNDVPLSGATFTLQPTDSEWNNNGTAINKPGNGENADNIFEFSNLPDGYYLLTETAPSGYQSISEAVKFRIENGEVSIVSKPSEVEWTDKTAVFKVTNTSETPGNSSVKVVKRWTDENGNEITGTQSVNVTLKRMKMDGVKGHKVTVNLYCTAYDSAGNQVKAAVLLESFSGYVTGTTATISWDQGNNGLSQNQLELPSGITATIKQPWDFPYDGIAGLTLSNIDRDISVTVYNGPGINNIDVNSTIKNGEVSDPSGGTVAGTGLYEEDETFSMSQTLTAPNYTYTWSSLAENDSNGNPYKYYVVEEDIPGFTKTIIPASAKELDTTGNIVTIYNKQNTPTESYKNLEIDKSWLTGAGATAEAGDSVDYLVTFEVFRQEVSSAPTDGKWLVKDTDTSYSGTWESIGEYTVAPGAQDGASSTGAEGNPVFGSWKVNLSKLVVSKIYGEGSTSNKYYVYKVVEKSIKKSGETKDVQTYNPTQDNPTISGDNGTITVKNTFANEYGVELPSTGGPGTRLFTILGSILILGAGVLLWRRRRTI